MIRRDTQPAINDQQQKINLQIQTNIDNKYDQARYTTSHNDQQQQTICKYKQTLTTNMIRRDTQPATMINNKKQFANTNKY